MVAAAVEIPIPSRTFLITMGRADGTIYVQYDVFELVK